MGLTREQTAEKWALFEQGLKKCCGCSKILPLEKFNRNPCLSDGRGTECKQCMAKRRRKPEAKAKRERKEWLLRFEFKDCPVCKRTLPHEAFHHALDRKSGRASHCKECKTKRGRVNVGSVKERRKERQLLATQGLKRCSHCNQILPLSAFYKSSRQTDGYTPRCIECCRDPEERKRKRVREKLLEERVRLAKQGLKRCVHCKEIKSVNRFYNCSSAWDGKHYVCKLCASKQAKAWRSKNADRVFENNRYRRYLQYQTESTLTNSDWKFALEYWGNKCAYCGKETEDLHQEHFIPVNKGGGYTPANIIPADARCNFSKNDMLFDEWATGRGRDRVRPGAKDRIERYFGIVSREV